MLNYCRQNFKIILNTISEIMLQLNKEKDDIIVDRILDLIP